MMAWWRVVPRAAAPDIYTWRFGSERRADEVLRAAALFDEYATIEFSDDGERLSEPEECDHIFEYGGVGSYGGILETCSRCGETRNVPY